MLLGRVADASDAEEGVGSQDERSRKNKLSRKTQRVRQPGELESFRSLHMSDATFQQS